MADMERTEKITINLGPVDLGQIDLLVQEGFYSNRTDFIRTAIRNHLSTHSDAVKQAVALRMRFAPRILALAETSAATGEPILRQLAYVFPDGGYENVKDQFLMGDDLLARIIHRGR